MDKLAQDSTDAIKAGMSYGKYMAMKKPVEVTMKDENHYICEFCGKAFYTKYHKGQKYCSPECQEKAKDRRQSERKKSEKPPIIKTCGICGKEFIGKKVQAKYCGDDYGQEQVRAECQVQPDERRRD